MFTGIVSGAMGQTVHSLSTKGNVTRAAVTDMREDVESGNIYSTKTQRIHVTAEARRRFNAVSAMTDCTSHICDHDDYGFCRLSEFYQD